MRVILTLSRFVGALALLTALLAAWHAPAAAQAETATLIIHKLECPADATGDIFEACHDNRLGGVEFAIGEAIYTTNGEGVIETEVAAGDVQIVESNFEEVATAGEAFVYCSVQATDQEQPAAASSDVLFQGTTDTGDVTVPGIPAGSTVICDWYNRTLPTATVTIHKLECPADATGDIFEACHDNRLEGVDFTIGDTDVTTDEDGVASATVVAGDVTIVEPDFGTIATAGTAFVFCSVQEDGSGTVLFEGNTTTGEVTVEDVPSGQEVICDWYNRTEVEATPTTTAEPTEAPTEEPTEAPTETAEATATSGPQLPETGVGVAGGPSGGSLALGALLFAVTAGFAALGLRRRPAA
jgi:hypothetical protein